MPESAAVSSPRVLWEFVENSPVQLLLHRLKYGNSPWLGIETGRQMARILKHDHDADAIDAVVPIPLHRARYLERGYNQSEWIAQGCAESLGVSLVPGLLRRTRATVSQTTLTKEERYTNVAGVFEVRHDTLVKGKRILVIDDTLTTGSTLKAAIYSLLEKDARSVIPAAAAVAPLRMALEPGLTKVVSDNHLN